MTWVFPAFLVASVLHIFEEYVFPGGFMDLIKRVNPSFAPLVTRNMAVVINGLQLLLCIIAITVGKNFLAFSLSIASLVLINGLVHIGACVRVRGYAPGSITGTLLYLPLGIYGYYTFAESGQLTLAQAEISVILGILFQLVPIAYFVIGVLRRA